MPNRIERFAVGKLKLPPPTILHDQNKIEQWFAGLGPDARGRFQVYLNELIDRQPDRIKRQIYDKFKQIQSSSLGVVSLGAAALSAGIQASTSIGLSLYNGHEQRNLQRELAGQEADLELQMGFLQSQVQKEIAKAQADAQLQAAQYAKEAQEASAKEATKAAVETAKIQALTEAAKHQQTTKTVAGSSTTVAVLAALVAGGYFMTR